MEKVKKSKVLRQSGKAYSDVTEKVRCERKVNRIRSTHSKTYGNFFGCCEFYDNQNDIHSQFWSKIGLKVIFRENNETLHKETDKG